MTWKLLQRLGVSVDKQEVQSAMADADRKDHEVARRTTEVQRIVGRLNEHGTRNHIGERVNAGITANLAVLAAGAKGA